MKPYITLLLLLSIQQATPQTTDTSLWHNKQRELRYHPEGTDFVIVNGTRRFVRALYGTNTAFRIEAGDLPEFALYMPGMGGNLQFGLISAGKSKWLIQATSIKAIYRPGAMLYEIKDSILGGGTLYLSVLALADREGVIIKTEFKNLDRPVEFVTVFGGASGKKFSRDGDIGADPESSFYLEAENCADNTYAIDKNSFHLVYGSGKMLTTQQRNEMLQPDQPAGKNLKQLKGIFPLATEIKVGNASDQAATPNEIYHSTGTIAPVIAAKMKAANATSYFLVYNPAGATPNTMSPKEYFDKAEIARLKIANRVKVVTPDAYINTLGATLSVAADAIWEDPSYLHGAVAWRMRLNAWRGAYAADPLGWHDRARKHFSSYALSQVVTPPVTGVVMDTALHLARHLEKIGTALFSDGYICRNPNGDIRAHHYDMNLVFVDQLLNHFNWTGDTGYIREMWPFIQRHLAWEKRNFDADGDGLYDAYAAIWASDALQYSGGGVTHSSAYNYRANKTAARLAALIGEDRTPYEKEATRIISAVQKDLWLPQEGWYAEYKDLLGKQLVHPSAGLWTIYQALDSKLPDPFQAYQSLRYIDTKIPHIPVHAKGLYAKDLYLLSTSNWQPYTWSINNVALAENLQTALAYWQGNRNEDAYRLWKSAIIESMYLSASPGGFEQLSFYDAIRGELYRDFADPIGVAARSLVEGLFGIHPDALSDTLAIQPGYPSSWSKAELQIPDLRFSFERKGNTDNYHLSQLFKKPLQLKIILPAIKEKINRVTINGKDVVWTVLRDAVNRPLVQILAPRSRDYKITIQWADKPIAEMKPVMNVDANSPFTFYKQGWKIVQLYDPQQVLGAFTIKDDRLTAVVLKKPGDKTFFIQVSQGAFTWWQPVNLHIMPILAVGGFVPIHSDFATGQPQQEKLNLQPYFNDKVINIFKHLYLSPRPKSPTLQLPTQGIGNWCYPLVTASIDDRGIRKLAKNNNEILSGDGIAFETPTDTTLNNIIFTSQWDNFPDSVNIPISGKAKQLHLLVAGTTNPMQSRLINGMVTVSYADGTADTLFLKNPENWWPIEQDYYTDGYAFTTGEKRPERLYLKEGRFSRYEPIYHTIKGFTDRSIDGGAATVLQLSLDGNKTLQTLSIHAVANDVIIGVMGATLLR